MRNFTSRRVSNVRGITVIVDVTIRMDFGKPLCDDTVLDLYVDRYLFDPVTTPPFLVVYLPHLI